ncbi:LuxR C-terminal-related transcriptional regulator [Rhizobium sp. XQZ8]|uniref:helix-turn-helix transcriptional regulator n=1 Tax=Rhizobium populisoli TaxID=2859785 RepID=UPI001CA48906|nr:LuxR C-terminal-related transcriptional regulator [Rhizobium populisoli]MBW6421243.1 LuxR C-terminal-related transcriptional regulator [Rhizobium populisoli]
MKAEGTLADSLYEAALVPELWTEACERLASHVGSSTAAIFTVDPAGTHRYVASRNIDDAYAKFSQSELRFQNIRPQRALEKFPFSFARDIDFLTKEERENDVILREFIRPAGMEWEAGCGFQEPTGHTIIVALMRSREMSHFSDEQMAQLDGLKPDLARAAYISSRLAFNEARSITQTLALLGLPAAVIGDNGQAIAMNAEIEELSPRIRTGAGDRLVLEGRGANLLLEEAVERYRAQATPTVQSLPMLPRDGAPALILHLLPIRRAARDVFSRSMAVLAVTQVGQLGPPDMRVLCGLFDLTPAEARVARAVAIAQTPEMIAATLGISLETARSHLKKIMQKTGTTRQAELVLLLSGLAAPSFGAVSGAM